VAWADVDGDGDADLFVGNYGQKNALYLNDGKGKLSAAASSAATAGSENTYAVAWADADGDGDQDLFVGNYNGKNALYLTTRCGPGQGQICGVRGSWCFGCPAYSASASGDDCTECPGGRVALEAGRTRRRVAAAGGADAADD